MVPGAAQPTAAPACAQPASAVYWIHMQICLLQQMLTSAAAVLFIQCHHIIVCGHLQVLLLDASNVEAIACLAADHFYSDQPELALRYYRRLLQVWELI